MSFYLLPHLFHPRDAVAIIDKHHFRHMYGDLGLYQRRIGANDQKIAQMHATRCCTIECNCPTATFSTDRIGRKTLTIIDVVELDFFKFRDISRFQQVLIDPA